MVKLGSKVVKVIVEHGDTVTINLGREVRTVRREELTFEPEPPVRFFPPDRNKPRYHSGAPVPCGEIVLGQPELCNLGVSKCELCVNEEVCRPAFHVIGHKIAKEGLPYPIVTVCRGCYKQFCIPLRPKEVRDEG